MQVTLWCKGESQPEEATRVGTRTKTDEKREKALFCRRCGSRISAEEYLFGKGRDTPLRVFSNPYGLLREVLTLREACGLELVGPATTEFSWFSGYAWEIAYCATCNTHMGWRFVAVSESEPREFYGLLRAELMSGEKPND